MADVDAMIADLMVDLNGDGVPDAPLSSQLVQKRFQGQPGNTIAPQLGNDVINGIINPMIANKPNVQRPPPQTWGELAKSFGRHVSSLPMQIVEGVANLPNQIGNDMQAMGQYQPGSGNVPVNAMLNVGMLASPAGVGRGMATTAESAASANAMMNAIRKKPSGEAPRVYQRPPYTPQRMQSVPPGARPIAEQVTESMPVPRSTVGEFYGPMSARDASGAGRSMMENIGENRIGQSIDRRTGRFVRQSDALAKNEFDRVNQYPAVPKPAEPKPKRGRN